MKCNSQLMQRISAICVVLILVLNLSISPVEAQEKIMTAEQTTMPEEETTESTTEITTEETTETTPKLLELTEKICRINGARVDPDHWYQSVDSIAFPSGTVKYAKIKKGTEYLFGTDTEYADTDTLKGSGTMTELLTKLNASGKYTIQMAEKDMDGNLLAETDIVSIQVDTINPTEITIEQGPDDAWTNESIQIKVKAADDIDGSGIKQYQYVYSGKGFDQTEQVMTSGDGMISIDKADAVIEEVHIRAVDNSGRTGKSIKIAVKYDSQKALLKDFIFKGKRNVTLAGTVEDKGSGVQKVECVVHCVRFAGTALEQRKDYPVVSYEYQKGDEILNSYVVNENWSNLTGKVTYTVKVTDFAGNVKEYPVTDSDKPYVNADNIAPEGLVYVSYEDEYEDGSQDYEILADTAIAEEKLFFLQNSLKSHKVYIYGYDVDSDVKEFEVGIIDSAGKEVWTGTTGTVTTKSGKYAACKINTKNYNYACLELPMVILSQAFHENQIKVYSMTDTADNVRTFSDAEGTALTKLVGDKINPELEMELTNCISNYGNDYYFKDEGQVCFSVNGEKYFEKGQLDVLLNGGEGASWIQNEKGGYSWILKKNESADLEEVKEISIKYKDPNGNLLCAFDTGIMTIRQGRFEGRLVFDNKAPVLKDFGLDGDYVTGEDGVFYYTHRNAECGMTGHIQIEENNLDYNNSEAVELRAVRLDGDRKETVIPVQWMADTGLQKESQIEKQQKGGYAGTFSFNQEGKYKLVLSVKDRSDNKMETDKEDLSVKDGIFESKVFVIDHTVPVLQEVAYETPAQITDPNGNTVSKVAPEFATISYYQSKSKVTVKVKEEYFFEKDFHFYVNGEMLPANQLIWKHEGNINTGVFDMEAKDGEYQVTCGYTDKAGLALDRDVSLDEKLFDAVNHEYSGPLMIIDTINPVISYVNDKLAVREVDGRKYYKKASLLRIVVEEKNFRITDTDIQFSVSAQDSSDRTVKEAEYLIKEWNEKIHDIRNWKQAGNQWIFDMLLDVDANYTVAISYTDLAKRNVSNVIEKVTVDTRQPYVDKITFKKADTDKLADFINYVTYGYFARDKIQVDITYQDDISGIFHLEYYAVENGERVKLQKEKMTKGKDSRKVTFLLPENFKGYVTTSVEDKSSNSFAESYKGAVSENSDRHRESGSIAIIPEKEPNENGFYNSSVSLDLKIEDSHSGIKNYSYTAGKSENNFHSYEKDAGKDSKDKATEKETYVWKQKVVLKGSENDNNHIKVKVNYEDNAGNKESLEKEYKIDVTKPEITVTYDNHSAQNEKYYKEGRTATITVKERNFDEDDFNIIFTTTGPKPQIGPWHHIQNTGEYNDALHTCEVNFSDDGDYTLTVKGQDMAGNKADYNQVDEFTVDKTIPVISVTYSNNDVRNQYYYKAPRTANITIDERNFDEKDIQVAMNSKNNGKLQSDSERNETGKQYSYSIGRYKRIDDRNTASIVFDSDGEYTWSMNYTDKAGNKAKMYGEDHFVIDLTKPVVKIFDVEDKAAYNGRIAPGVEYTDANCDVEGATITLFGYKTGSSKLVGSSMTSANNKRQIISSNIAIANGRRIKMANFEQKKNIDDLYVLSASVLDKAGNEEKAQVTFSVNRFGSVYILDEETKDLVDTYYTNEEKKIGITEINVNTLRAREVSYSKDGSVNSLDPGKDYTVKESTNLNKWKEYHYEIPAVVFAEEGVYEVSVYSEDMADNKSDNVIKGTPIEFAIDKTNPVVVIAGVRNKERYNAATREIIIDAKDNLGVSSVKLYYGDQIKQFAAKQIQEAGGIVKVTAKASNHWQNVYAEVTDVAGNSVTTEVIEFLLTKNILIQFYNNKVALYSSMGGTAILLCLILFLLAKKKKDGKGEEKI